MATQPIRAIIIPTNTPGEVREIQQDARTLQTIVGGYLQSIPAHFDQDGNAQVLIWCNDNSKIDGEEVNHPATALWWALDPDMRGIDTLNGTIIVTGGVSPTQDVLPIPDLLESSMGQYHSPRSVTVT